jgi:hypothetical protein
VKRLILIAGLLLLIGFLAWRFLRPLNIFVVEDRFAWPVDTGQVPTVLGDLRAETCGACHTDFYTEWQTTIHSRAWTDPYFQADWQFDDSQHICRLCHTPLDRQQPHKVLDYRDKDKWDPVLADNPDFDPVLQYQGVTCAACHYRDGKIVGTMGDTAAPHPVKKLADPNEVCVRCHVVGGERWDTFFRFPPCGTVAEIASSQCQIPPPADLQRLARLLTPAELAEMKQQLPVSGVADQSGEAAVPDVAALGCVQCHMPLTRRPLVKGGQVRTVRRHLWRGGHDPAMVRSALRAELVETPGKDTRKRKVIFTLINVGAAHYVPTGTPDRHLTVELRALDRQGKVIEAQQHVLKRTVLWRPFIIDLWDTRLPRWQPRSFELELSQDREIVAVEAVVRYHLLDERRRERIGYINKEPIAYEVLRRRLELQGKTE